MSRVVELKILIPRVRVKNLNAHDMILFQFSLINAVSVSSVMNSSANIAKSRAAYERRDSRTLKPIVISRYSIVETRGPIGCFFSLRPLPRCQYFRDRLLHLSHPAISLRYEILIERVILEVFFRAVEILLNENVYKRRAKHMHYV